jgi:hypothetical protein
MRETNHVGIAKVYGSGFGLWLRFGSGLAQVFLRLEPSKLLLFLLFIPFGSMAQENILRVVE